MADDTRPRAGQAGAQRSLEHKALSREAPYTPQSASRAKATRSRKSG